MPDGAPDLARWRGIAAISVVGGVVAFTFLAPGRLGALTAGEWVQVFILLVYAAMLWVMAETLQHARSESAARSAEMREALGAMDRSAAATRDAATATQATADRVRELVALHADLVLHTARSAAAVESQARVAQAGHITPRREAARQLKEAIPVVEKCLDRCHREAHQPALDWQDPVKVAAEVSKIIEEQSRNVTPEIGDAGGHLASRIQGAFAMTTADRKHAHPSWCAECQKLADEIEKSRGELRSLGHRVDEWLEVTRHLAD